MLLAQENALAYIEIQRNIRAEAFVTTQQGREHSKLGGYPHFKNEFDKIAVSTLFADKIQRVHKQTIYVVCTLAFGNGVADNFRKIRGKRQLLHIKAKPVKNLHRLAAVEIIPSAPFPKAELAAGKELSSGIVSRSQLLCPLHGNVDKPHFRGKHLYIFSVIACVTD